MNRPALALFDVDGTLFDSERLWAIALALALEGLGERRTPEALSALIYGMAWPDAWRTLRRTFPEALAEQSAHSLGRMMVERFEALFAARPPVIQPAIDLLRRLNRAGIPCAFVSGSPRATIHKDLRAAGIDALLDLSRSVASDDVTCGKPDPEGYRRAIAAFGADPAQTVAFEDSRVGAAAALAAGIGRVYVCPPPGAPEQDYPAGALRLPSWEACPLPLP